jgi:hypothetical protein
VKTSDVDREIRRTIAVDVSRHHGQATRRRRPRLSGRGKRGGADENESLVAGPEIALLVAAALLLITGAAFAALAPETYSARLAVGEKQAARFRTRMAFNAVAIILDRAPPRR